jgi:uncharacterized oligopeptide transporter (OPT) family protein
MSEIKKLYTHEETVKIPILLRPVAAVGILLFFVTGILFAAVGGLMGAVIASIIMLYNGEITMSYK